MERDEQELLEKIRPLQAEARERLAEPPSPERLLAYHEGRLDPEARLAVEEGIAAFPESGRLLRDLARFPDLAPPAGVAAPTGEEIDARWRELRAARRASGAAGPETRAATAPAEAEPLPRLAPITPLPAPRQPPPRLPRDTDRRHWRTGLALAATLVVGIGLGHLLALRSTQPEPRANLALAPLAPLSDSTRRGGEAAELAVPPDADGVLLSIGYGGPVQPRYSLTIEDPGGDRILHRTDLQPDDTGTFLVELPRELLTRGRYRLELSAPGEPEPLATYALDLIFR